MIFFHILYFWQRGIRKLELERTKFGKFASQGTNNSRSWKFKFEGVLGRKIYLHDHLFFSPPPSPHFREHPPSWNYSVDSRYCSSIHETRPFAGHGCPIPRRSASKIPLCIRDGMDICRGEISKQAARRIEGSVIRRLSSKTFSKLVV